MTEPRRLEVERCPCCGSSERDALHLGLPDRLHGTEGSTDLYACRTCSSVYQNPMIAAEDLFLVYPDTYYTRSAPPSRARRHADAFRDRVRLAIQAATRGESTPSWALVASRLRPLRVRAFYDLLEDVIPDRPEPGKALEIGPGSGWELGRLAASGWAAEGIEWDPVAAEVAAKVSGCSVRVGEVHQLVEEGRRFDLVYAHHVLEHIPDPVAALESVGRLLTDTGRAVVVVPNPVSVGARRWGAHWTGWDPPRHVVLPSAEGLRAVADRAGVDADVRALARNPGARARYSSGGVGSWSGTSGIGMRVREWVGVWSGQPSGEELLAVFTPSGR